MDNTELEQAIKQMEYTVGQVMAVPWINTSREGQRRRPMEELQPYIRTVSLEKLATEPPGSQSLASCQAWKCNESSPAVSRQGLMGVVRGGAWVLSGLPGSGLLFHSCFEGVRALHLDFCLLHLTVLSLLTLPSQSSFLS